MLLVPAREWVRGLASAALRLSTLRRVLWLAHRIAWSTQFRFGPDIRFALLGLRVSAVMRWLLRPLAVISVGTKAGR